MTREAGDGRLELTPVARIRSDFPEKFGIPRQSGLVRTLTARVVFEPEFRDPAALRGIEGFSHLWLIWEFSQSAGRGWSPTVRPPRLGGNQRLGVFATRAPFRRLPSGGPGRLCRPAQGALSGGGARPVAGAGAPGEAGGAGGRVGPGSPPPVPERPTAGLRHGVWGAGGPVPGGG